MIPWEEVREKAKDMDEEQFNTIRDAILYENRSVVAILEEVGVLGVEAEGCARQTVG